MHIEIESSSKLFIFINSLYVKSFEKDDLIELVKKVIKKYKNKFSLKGFYKVKVFVNKNIGLFIDIYKLDDLDYSNSLDLRVLIFLDEDFYFETDDYFILDGLSDIRYWNGKYYSLANDVDVNKLVEFGRFIYGNEASLMLDNSFRVE